jgi:hypothetical protein
MMGGKGGKGCGKGRWESYLSITCITPFATMISVIVTCALLTKTFLSTLSILILSPITVGKLSFASPLVNKLEYPTVPLITWYSRILASCVSESEDAAEPISWNALLDGAKIVTSFNESTVETRLVCVKAPARAVSSESIADIAGDKGTVSTVSMI